MKISARSVLMAGVATVTASAVAIAPSVQPPPPPAPAIQLAADGPAAGRNPRPHPARDAAAPILTRLLGPASADRNAPPPPAPIRVLYRAEPRQHDRQHLHRRRALGAIWVRGRHSTWSAGFRGSAGSPARSWHLLHTSASAWSPASSSTSPIGSGAMAASWRTWSISASTSAWHSSGLESTQFNFLLPPLPPVPPLPPRPPHAWRPCPGLDDALGPDGGAGGRSRECRQSVARPCSTAFSTTPSTPTETSTGLSRAALR